MQQDLIRNLSDPRWRVNNLYKIVNKEGQRVGFKENNVQRFSADIQSRLRMILKARQFGISTHELIRMFDDTIWNENKTNVILAHEQDAIAKLFRIVRRAYQFMPEDLRPELDRGGGSKYEMFFPSINSRIYCDLESRGDTISWLHVSEAAFIDDENRLKATIEAVPVKTGRVTMESTPNGLANMFYELWQDPDAPFAKAFFPWYLFPEYQIESDKLALNIEEKELVKKARKLFNINLTYNQIAFRRYKKSIQKGLFIQEYPEDDASCFLTSGNVIMDLVVISELLKKAPEPIEYDEDLGLTVYKKYDKNKEYVIGADVSEGVGGDASCGAVMEASSREQVATIHNNGWKPSEFAYHLNNLAKRYWMGGRMMPLLSVERNNHGHACLLALEEIEKYPNLYRHTDDRLGWLTDKVTRPLILDNFVEGVENQTVIINDKPTLRECMTFVNNDGKMEAANGKHDDRILATAIAQQMCVEYRHGGVYNKIAEKVRI